MSNTENRVNTIQDFLGLQNVQDFADHPLQFMLDLAQTQGDIATYKFGPMYQVYLVSNADYIREILVKQWEKTVKWERMANAARFAADYNLAILEGDIWKKHRKLLTPAFHTQRIQDYITLMRNHAQQMLNRWEDGATYDMTTEMATSTMGIIGEILFDIPDIEKDAAELSKSLDVLIWQIVNDSKALIPLPKWIPTEEHRREREARDTFMAYVDHLIAGRRAEGNDHGDVLSALLLARDADTGEALSNDEVRDELYAFFVAGYETTSLLVTWALYMLAKHPEIQTAMQAEADAVLSESLPTLENLAELELTDRVMKETLRLYPPAWSLFVRDVVEDIVFDDGVKIPKGGVLYISPYLQHHLPQYWDDPTIFDPSRFEGDWKAQRPAYAFMPFGGGARVCIGSHMAEMEAKVLLSTIAKHYTIELANPDEPVHTDAGFTLRPYPEMRLRVRAR